MSRYYVTGIFAESVDVYLIPSWIRLLLDPDGNELLPGTTATACQQ